MEAIMQNLPWNKGRLTGQKRPPKPKDVWAIRVRLQLQHRARDLALFNLAIDSKLRGCDLVRLQIDDVCASGRVRDRANIIQKKTGRPVQFEITEQTRAAIRAWLPEVEARNGRHGFVKVTAWLLGGSGGRVRLWFRSPIAGIAFRRSSSSTRSGCTSGSLWSYRDVEDLLAERGLDISYESVRSWVLKFGPAIARAL